VGVWNFPLHTGQCLSCKPGCCIDIWEVAEIPGEQDFIRSAGAGTEGEAFEVDSVRVHTQVRPVSNGSTIRLGNNRAVGPTANEPVLVSVQSSCLHPRRPSRRATVQSIPSLHVQRQRIDQIQHAWQLRGMIQKRRHAKQLYVGQIVSTLS
jgi:hypothetical protein